MSLAAELRVRWERVLDLLRQHDAPLLAAISERHSWTTDEGLERFLLSNELWGGSGSIADQAGITTGRTAQRREIEMALADLGTEQIRLGKANRRTAMWTRTFQQWKRSDI